MSHNLAGLSPDEHEKMEVDLQASGIAFKERYDMPVSVRDVEQGVPEHLRDYFNSRLKYYRALGEKLGKLAYEPKENGQ